MNILDEDWDTLIVLDACRADLFDSLMSESETRRLQFDERTTRTSNASATPEWLRRTFGDSHGDIVYVAGNPMVAKYCANSFHELIEVWRDAYDPKTSIISPGGVTERAIDARTSHPDKRLIVHYMQPHYPFIERPELDFAKYGFDNVGLETDPAREENVGSVWKALALDMVDRSDVWEGYRHNLDVVLENVSILVDAIDDRRVITSDHGNMVGERNWPVPIRTYGHPRNHRNPALTRVP